jgi:hypothetical protein
MGAKLYNELPLNIRSATSSEDFYKLLKLHFSSCIFIYIHYTRYFLINELLGTSSTFNF